VAFQLLKKLSQKLLPCPTQSKALSKSSIMVSFNLTRVLFLTLLSSLLVAEKSLSSTINAHDSELGALQVNPDGTLIASASQKGTVIKIFSADGGETLQTLRRGSSTAVITSIVFHPSLNIIACTSNKSSIHIFEIKKSIEKCIELK